MFQVRGEAQVRGAEAGIAVAITFTKGYVSFRNPGANNLAALTARGSWNASGTPQFVSIEKYRQLSNAVAASKAEAVSTNPWRVMVMRAVTDPLEAEASYSGTINPMLGVGEDDASGDFFWFMHVWVTVGETDSVRATLLSNYGESSTNEWPATAAGLRFQSAQAIAGTWSRGDRIVCEIGYIARNASATSRTGSVYWRSKSTNADLTAGSTSVTTQNGYLEFSPALTLAAPDNNHVEDAIVVTTFPYTVTQDQQYAGGDSGTNGDFYVPYVGGDFAQLNATLWWKYVATYTGNLYVSVEGSIGTAIRVGAWEDYTAVQLKTSAADGNTIVDAQNPDTAGNLVIPVVSGKTYFIIAGYDETAGDWGTFGPLTMTIDTSPIGAGPTPPANDACVDAEVIAALPFTETDLDTRGADDANAPANSLGTIYAPVFYSYTPAGDGSIAAYASGEVSDVAGATVRRAIVGVYSGACGSLVEVKSGVGGVGVPVMGGTTYTIVIGSEDAGGWKHLNLTVIEGITAYTDDFESYTTPDTLHGGDFAYDPNTNQVWGLVRAGAGDDASQAVTGLASDWQGTPEQTDFQKGLLPFTAGWGVIEFDAWLGASAESAVVAVRPGAFVFGMSVFGTWDATNSVPFAIAPGTWPNLPVGNAVTNIGYRWFVTTPFDFSTDELHLRFTADGGSTLIYDVPLGVDASDYPGWHHYLIAFRHSTYVGDVAQADGGVEVWIDGIRVAQVCEVELYTDLREQWNGAGFNPHGAVDNLEIAELDIVECTGVCPTIDTVVPTVTPTTATLLFSGSAGTGASDECPPEITMVLTDGETTVTRGPLGITGIDPDTGHYEWAFGFTGLRPGRTYNLTTEIAPGDCGDCPSEDPVAGPSAEFTAAALVLGTIGELAWVEYPRNVVG